jgi:hypothetical protein
VNLNTQSGLRSLDTKLFDVVLRNLQGGGTDNPVKLAEAIVKDYQNEQAKLASEVQR